MAESTSGVHHTVSPDGEILAPVHEKCWQDSLGSPTPFNLVCFAMTALITGMAATHWVDPVRSQGITVAITLFLGGIGMVMGSLLEWIKGNTFGFTVFAAYGFYHITYAMSVIFANKGLVTSGPVDPGTYAGYFWGWLVLSIFMFTYTLKHTGAFTLLFAIVLIVFILLAVGYTIISQGHSSAGTVVLKVEGYVVMLFAILGLYLAVAEINLWYPYPIVTVSRDPLTGEAKSATVVGSTKTSSSLHRGSLSGPSSPNRRGSVPLATIKCAGTVLTFDLICFLCLLFSAFCTFCAFSASSAFSSYSLFSRFVFLRLLRLVSLISLPSFVSLSSLCL